MIATAALADRSLTEAGLSCSGYCKATGDVLDDGGARSARDECCIFHDPSFGRNLLNLARPFTACISSVLPSTGRIAEEAQTQHAM